MRFDRCCTANKWTDATKAAKLLVLLEGEAIAIWLELSEEQQSDYNIARKEITTIMIPTEFVSLDHFHKRKVLAGEPLSVFVHEIKKLLDQAMPTLEKNADFFISF